MTPSSDIPGPRSALERTPTAIDGAEAAGASGSAFQIADPGWNDSTWTGTEPSAPPPKTIVDKLRGALRLLLFVLATLVLLPPFFIARAMGGRRDRRIAALWCGAGMALCGLRARQVGAPLTGGGALLANHASWLDIMTIGWLAPVHFVAKAEVSGWPLFGWIGRISNTVFIERRRTEAKAQERYLIDRARGGDLLCVFPEGTSSDGLRVLPFKSSLFAMFFTEAESVAAQPVTVAYQPARPDLAPSFYGWWGRMALFQHIWDVTCLSRGGLVTVIFHPPLDRAEHGDRKLLATAAQQRVAEGLEQTLSTQLTASD